MHYQWRQQNIYLHCYIQPSARKDEIAGIYDPGPQQRLKIRITAPPLDGKANQHLQKLIAKWFAVSKKQVTIIRGANSRLKTLLIENPQQFPNNSGITTV